MENLLSPGLQRRERGHHPSAAQHPTSPGRGGMLCKDERLIALNYVAQLVDYLQQRRTECLMMTVLKAPERHALE